MKLIIKTILFIFTCLNYISAQNSSFTYTGPSSVTTSFGAISAAATFNFSYNLAQIASNETYKLEIRDNGKLVQSKYITPTTYSLYLTPGVHQIRFILIKIYNKNDPSSVGKILQSQSTNVVSKVLVKIENNFSGGIISVDNVIRNAPYFRESTSGESFNIGAIEQNDGLYNRIWNSSGINNSNWRHNNGEVNQIWSSSKSTAYNVTNYNSDTYITANLRKRYSVNFNTNFGSGSIVINDISYPEPAVTEVVEQNSITAEVTPWFRENGLEYNFIKWSNNNLQNKTVFFPQDNTTYTANYDIKPLSSGPLLCISSVGQPITIQWQEHPHPDVTMYAIYRKKKSDTLGVLLGTVNKQSNNGTLTFTDNDYRLTKTYTNELLSYDVRPYYSPSGTYADANYRRTVFGEVSLFKNGSYISDNFSGIIEYAISNYPNPFNPTTNINYQLPNTGHVTIKVYDMLGKEVTELVNAIKEAGAYNVTFNGDNLSSGTYLLNIIIDPKTSTQKEFVQTKKILLLK